MLITLQKTGKSFGAERVLRDVTAAVDRQGRIGVIGENGTGKTTLLRIITGELQPDEGEVTYSHNLTWGYLEQNAALDTARTCLLYTSASWWGIGGTTCWAPKRRGSTAWACSTATAAGRNWRVTPISRWRTARWRWQNSFWTLRLDCLGR